jgi:hypothetical protein
VSTCTLYVLGNKKGWSLASQTRLTQIARLRWDVCLGKCAPLQETLSDQASKVPIKL